MIELMVSKAYHDYFMYYGQYPEVLVMTEGSYNRLNFEARRYPGVPETAEIAYYHNMSIVVIPGDDNQWVKVGKLEDKKMTRRKDFKLEYMGDWSASEDTE